jgi:hypothetical protein
MGLGLSVSNILMAFGALRPHVWLLPIGRGSSGLTADCLDIAQTAITDMCTP